MTCGAPRISPASEYEWFREKTRKKTLKKPYLATIGTRNQS